MNTKLLKKHWPRVALAAAGAALCVLVLAQTGSKHSRAAVVAAKPAPAAVASVAPDPVVARKPLDYYTSGIRKDLFGAPPPPPAPKAPDVPVLPPIDSATAAVDPFADYAYTGTGTIGSQTVALVENTKTKDGQFLHVGDTFMGARIEGISDRQLTMSLAGKPRTMAKNDDYKLTPLDKDAPVNAPTAAPQNNGRPGGPGGPAGMIQRFMNASPDQREQMIQRFMNRFNRNGNGGGGRGGRRGPGN